MSYFVISNDSGDRDRWKGALEAHGYDVVEEYDPDAVVVTLGGDGTILYAARTCPEPTILPVRTGDSKGDRTQLEVDELLSALEAIETGQSGEEYTVVEHRKLAAYQDGRKLRGEFTALNEISVHHASPTLAAVFTARIHDRGETHEFERIMGDGLVVATPFGSTGYYRSITGGWLTDGLGVAFNNVHTPASTPDHVSVSEDAVVEVEVLASKHASGTVVSRDEDDEAYELDVGLPIEIRQSDDAVEILRVQPHE